MTDLLEASQSADSTVRHSRRVLFLGTHGQANIGDELLLDTFLTQMGRDHTYAVNSYDPAATSAQLRDRFDVTVFDTASDRVGLVRHILRSDVLVFGGGNILKELYRSVGRWTYSTLVMVLAVVLLARVARKPVLMANIGIGPVSSRFGRLLVRMILASVWLVSVRDAGSLRFARSVGCPPDKVHLVPDAVWVRETDVLYMPARQENSPIRIAINLNKDVDVADEWDAFLDRLVVSLNQVAATRPVEFHALPMQCSFKIGTDLEVLRDVLRRVDAPVHFHAPADHDHVAAIIAECDLVVSERLHAIVMSAILGCPVIALPYDVKVRELAAQLGIRERSFDVSADLDPAELTAAILHTLDNAERERRRLLMVATAKRRTSVAAFAAIRAWVAAPTRTWESSAT